MSDMLISNERTKDRNSLELMRRNQSKTDEVIDLFSKLISSTNTMNSDDAVVKGLVQTLLQEHPTLIQSFFRNLISASHELKDTHRFKNDLRVQATGKVLKTLSEQTEPLPFI